ncbi:MAG TPA: histidine kinase [Roseimicrobium sp.]|nr:histidine kinase [Roseimicrobium sp.]
MSRGNANLAGRYVAALRRYLSRPNEKSLQAAYDFGRTAIARGLGILDMARLHHGAIVTLLGQPPLPQPELMRRQAGAMEVFFLEALAPFEATHRGFHEACQRLQQLNTTLNHRNEDLRRLSSQILHVQELERTRISRELHDVVGQSLTAISVNLATVKKREDLQKSVERRIGGVQTMVGETMAAVHQFARELRPAILDDLGLVPALRSYIRVFRKRVAIRVQLSADPEVEMLDIENKTAVYRIVQECLTNVARHARASRADITACCQNGVFEIEISDNGRGFLPTSDRLGKGGKRLGLLGIRERVWLVNGEFQLESGPGQGTAIRVRIPLKNGKLPTGRVSGPADALFIHKNINSLTQGK